MRDMLEDEKNRQPILGARVPSPVVPDVRSACRVIGPKPLHTVVDRVVRGAIIRARRRGIVVRRIVVLRRRKCAAD